MTPGRGGRGRRTRAAAVAATLGAAAALAAGTPLPGGAQTLQGRVVDEETSRPIPAALVQLVDAGGDRRAATVADSAGRYRLEAPEPGEYHVMAEAFGYEPVRSLLFDLSNPDAAYPVDVGLRPAPIPVRGMLVTAERRAVLERSIQTAIALNPASLRTRPFLRSDLAEHVDRSHGMVDFLRWSNIAGLTIYETPDGPCFDLGGKVPRGGRRACVPVYLNEWRAPAWVVRTLDLDLLDAVVVVHPLESLRHENGAILLYSTGWLR